MVHFIHQMQYYITFEVLECSWDELWNKVQQAQDLDHIIAAHDVFLDTIISRCLLDNNSRSLLNQLRAIFDQIIEFQSAQDSPLPLGAGGAHPPTAVRGEEAKEGGGGSVGSDGRTGSRGEEEDPGVPGYHTKDALPAPHPDPLLPEHRPAVPRVADEQPRRESAIPQLQTGLQ
ncbi:Gamma-tubulin complex component 3 [Larimichthys crocea]|uniref:Uncharacterized protein n=1 Tax=Larimichthys crocea TaxID=215358 RepID=A0ACD3QXQ3_LARCR|nr:Gamma-tubulin complex component 3 [Larimichthys crocea]